MKRRQNDLVMGGVFSANFLENVGCLSVSINVIHHLHITGEIICYVHSFCNQKVRQNKNQISVIAHNLFGFDFSSS